MQSVYWRSGIVGTAGEAIAAILQILLELKLGNRGYDYNTGGCRDEFLCSFYKAVSITSVLLIVFIKDMQLVGEIDTNKVRCH